MGYFPSYFVYFFNIGKLKNISKTKLKRNFDMLYSKNNGNQNFDISNMNFNEIMEKINEILQTKKMKRKILSLKIIIKL